MKIMRLTILPLFISLMWSLSFSGRAKNHERWTIKTTYAETPNHPRTISIEDLADLPVPQNVTLSAYNRKLIGGEFRGFREGEFVTTTGWLHLAAFSTDDSDYHLQITASKTDGDNCVIVEIPAPQNTKSPSIRQRWLTDREFVNFICGGRCPSEGGRIIRPAVMVRVSGQLFYDISHKNPSSRGKKKMKAATSWEIHPVWKIRIAGDNHNGRP